MKTPDLRLRLTLLLCLTVLPSQLRGQQLEAEPNHPGAVRTDRSVNQALLLRPEEHVHRAGAVNNTVTDGSSASSVTEPSSHASRALFADVLFDLIQGLFVPWGDLQPTETPPGSTTTVDNLPSTAIFEPIRINCGGSAFQDSNGNSWLGDTYSNGEGRSSTDFFNTFLFGSEDASLFQSYRLTDRIFQQPMHYEIPVPNGKYQVTLYFAEMFFFLAAELRRFDVWLEDEMAFSSVDMLKESGGSRRAVAITKFVTVEDEMLLIQFEAINRNPYISAIEVQGVPDEPTEPPTEAPSKVPSKPPTEASIEVASEPPTRAPIAVSASTESPVPKPISPTMGPNDAHSTSPTGSPNMWPSGTPSASLTDVPLTLPSNTLTQMPNSVPTMWPMQAPSASPTNAPTILHSNSPTGAPNKSPTMWPTQNPSWSPTTSPKTPVTPAPVPLISNPYPPLSNGAWIETDPVADIQARQEACFVMVGRVAVLLGGRKERRTDIYNPAAHTWSVGAPPLLKEMHHMQCVAAQEKVWIMAAWTGGFPNEQTPMSAYNYDPILDVWSMVAPLPENRRRGSAAVVVSDDEKKIYVSHGNIGGHEQADFAVSVGYLDVYDIESNSWTAISDNAPNPRDHTGGAMIGGKLLCVAGGRDGGENGWPTVAPTDCYNLETGLWEVKASIPQERAGSAYGTTCDGRLIVAGGESHGQAWKNVDVFDGETWETIGSLNVQRHGTGLAVDCVCNQIYIASGNGKAGGGMELTSVETFFPDGVDASCLGSPTSGGSPTISPDTPAPAPLISNPYPPLSNGAWIEIDPVADIQARQEACFVMVGRVAVLLGGRKERRTDIYNPAARTWSVGAPPLLKEMHHMQCVAAQGKVWIMAAWTGGFPNEQTPMSAYNYDPILDVWSMVAPLPENRRRGSAAVVVSDDEKKIYVSHGNIGGHEQADFAVSVGYLDIYDIESNSWTAISDNAPNPRDHTGGAMIGGKLLCVAGGRNGGENGWPTVAPTDCYNLETGLWEVKASIPQERAGSAYGTTCDGRLIVEVKVMGRRGKMWMYLMVKHGRQLVVSMFSVMEQALL